MRRLDPNTIKYTNCTCRTVGRRNRHAATTPSPATIRVLFTLVFTANAHIVIPNVMRRPALNTIKYTNCICRILGRRNRHAGTTPSSATLLPATVRSPFTLRRSYRRRHRLVSFSSKSFRFGDVAALPIRSPRSVTDEYWYVASAAQLRAAEWRRCHVEQVKQNIKSPAFFAGRSGNLTIRRLRRTAPCGGVAGQLRYTPYTARHTTPEQRTRYLKLQ